MNRLIHIYWQFAMTSKLNQINFIYTGLNHYHVASVGFTISKIHLTYITGFMPNTRKSELQTQLCPAVVRWPSSLLYAMNVNFFWIGYMKHDHSKLQFPSAVLGVPFVP